MKNIIKLLIIISTLILVFIAGGKYYKLAYLDKCLDMGGGMSPGNYEICVIEKYLKTKQN